MDLNSGEGICLHQNPEHSTGATGSTGFFPPVDSTGFSRRNPVDLREFFEIFFAKIYKNFIFFLLKISQNYIYFINLYNIIHIFIFRVANETRLTGLGRNLRYLLDHQTWSSPVNTRWMPIKILFIFIYLFLNSY